jgi:hypothetical protein
LKEKKTREDISMTKRTQEAPKKNSGVGGRDWEQGEITGGR